MEFGGVKHYFQIIYQISEKSIFLISIHGKTSIFPYGSKKDSKRYLSAREQPGRTGLWK